MIIFEIPGLVWNAIGLGENTLHYLNNLTGIDFCDLVSLCCGYFVPVIQIGDLIGHSKGELEFTLLTA
ncbi:MAG: hypothetical protein A2161_07145 [Candidatus Schekmanbacteria bacterium RBG_13_48_7]|uniref:Uncharacterized protein n=1 Tax=Candidatus Schekmanbacteria bacterium RBG_13_48_7 TaxID=1817878 RepID=A0A1F7RQD8_9BACT|nr:MAG: hypothetical protein A2161_07145 [Candidatus Schekmanbacteria bacterium RBG_13_48_7]